MIGKGKANAGPKGTIAFSSLETQSGAMTVLRSISSFALVIGGLSIFLILASLLLVSNPIGSSFQDYFLGVNPVSGPQSPTLLSSDDNHTKDIISMPTPFQEGGQDLIFKDDNPIIWSSKPSTSPFSDNGEAIGKAGDASIMPEIAVNNSNDDVVGEGMNLNLRQSPPPFSSSRGKVINDSGSSEVAKGPAPSFGSGNYDGNFTTSEVSVRHHRSNISSIGGFKNCDLYHGKWVYDSEGPLYTNNSCPIITQMQNCQGNGRLDKEYENWRWKPERCMLPRFDGKKFLELMRGKTLAFVGDSVARNQMESLLCILWQVEVPKNRGNKRMHRWYFRSTSTMITRIWSSWLVHKASEPVEFAPEGVVKVHLDLPDEGFMEFLPDFDVVVLSSGHWFAKRSVYVLNRTIVGGQLWRPPPHAKLDMRINNIEAFGLSVETAVAAIVANPKFKGLAIVRSYSPDHYEGGAWNTGGSCTGKVSPASYVVRNGFTDVMHEKQVTGFKHAAQKFGNKSNLIFMDITEVFGYRPDGHPGPYRSPDPNKKTKRGPHGEPPPQDCLHWCMPGPVDTWNEFLLEIIWRYFQAF